MNIFDHTKKIEEAYGRMSYDEKAEFSECMKTVSATERMLFFGSLALLLIKIIKR